MPSLKTLALIPLLASSVYAGIETCIAATGITADFPGSTTWAATISPWQLRIHPIPAAVIFPTTYAQISAGLACAVSNNIKVSARNGGHSYGAYGLGGNHGALVIDMAAFQSVSLSANKKELTYGGGSIVGDVATWLWNNHQLHFPHVRANRVGLAGSSIGGAFGSTSRFLGTPMDNLVAVKYMLYNGQIITATRTSNKDLFWAAQGAGSSFGILLTLTTKTWEPTYSQVTNFTITLAETDINTGVNALLAIQNFFFTGSTALDKFSLRWVLTAPPFTGSGFFYGDPATFQSLIAPLMAALPSTATLTSAVADFWTMEKIATPQLDTQVQVYPPRNFYLQALVLRTNQGFTYDSAYKLYQYTTFAFNRTDLTKFGFLDLWGGVSRDIDDEDTSFAHEKSGWLVRWEGRLAAGLTQFPVDGIAYMQAGFKPFSDQLIAEGIPLRGFVNYRDTELTVAQWSSRLYAGNWNKLLKVKKRYDPGGYFTTNPQSIPVI